MGAMRHEGIGSLKIAVVGAGPAGSSAGFHLARGGHRVDLLDRSQFPRPKPCGDWITRGALRELESMELDRTRLRERTTAHPEIYASVLGAPNGTTSRVMGPDSVPSHCIPRTVFDTLLMEQACKAGCRFTRANVRDIHRVREEFDLVIDARGVYAGQANTIALHAYWTVPLNDIDSWLHHTVQLFTVDRFCMGYGWVFPVHRTQRSLHFNLGVGIWRAEYDARGINIREDFARFVQTNPVTQQLNRVAIDRGRTRGHHLALATGRMIVAQHGILRIGDAANLTDPITGEGIANAVLSGRLVAEAIGHTAKRSEAEHRWQHSYETRLWPELQAATRLRRLLEGTRRKNLALWVLRRRPGLAQRFHGSLEGVVSYRDIVPLPSWGPW